MSTETFDGRIVSKKPNVRTLAKGRTRLSREMADGMFRGLRALAASRQVWANWAKDGVPWEIAGPLLMERLSQTIAARSIFPGQEGTADMHKVMDAQGRVFQLAATYGPDSREFRMLLTYLDTFLPAVAIPAPVSTPARSTRKRGTTR